MEIVVVAFMLWFSAKAVCMRLWCDFGIFDDSKVFRTKICMGTSKEHDFETQKLSYKKLENMLTLIIFGQSYLRDDFKIVNDFQWPWNFICLK